MTNEIPPRKNPCTDPVIKVIEVVAAAVRKEKKKLPTIIIKKYKVNNNNKKNQRTTYRNVIRPLNSSTTTTTKIIGTDHNLSFTQQQNHQLSSRIIVSSIDDENENDNHPSNNNNNNDAEFDNLDDMDHFISNTDVVSSSLEIYTAIHSLQQNVETCLSIPMMMMIQQSTTTTMMNHNNDGTNTTTTNNNNDSIRGVLECQIIEWFTNTATNTNTTTDGTQHNNVGHQNHHHSRRRRCLSKRRIREQLQHLLYQNIIKCIPILQHSSSSLSNHKLYIWTKDYITYLQHLRLQLQLQQQQNQVDADIPPTLAVSSNFDWWIRQIENHTITASCTYCRPYITIHDIEQAWYNDPCTTKESKLNNDAKNILFWLQQESQQLLLSASYDHGSMYQLWLPTWGTRVLPTLNQLCHDIVLYIKRTPYKERSISSILQRFSQGQLPPHHQTTTTPSNSNFIGTTTRTRASKIHSSTYIPIEHVVIPYMVALGYVQRIERPSGICLTLLMR